MNTVYPNLYQELKTHGMIGADLAPIAEVSITAVYRRLRGETDWRLSEIVRICQYFENLDATWLFLRLDTNWN